SDNENMRVNTERQYKRMNREKFEEEADLRPEAGSLWVMEGQGAYLFSQNQMRMVGDLLNVRIEGSPKTQLRTKVRVIARLLERLESSRGVSTRAPASARPGDPRQPAPGAANPAAPGQTGQPGADGQPAATPDGQTPAPAAAAANPQRA